MERCSLKEKFLSVKQRIYKHPPFAELSAWNTSRKKGTVSPRDQVEYIESCQYTKVESSINQHKAAVGHLPVKVGREVASLCEWFQGLVCAGQNFADAGKIHTALSVPTVGPGLGAQRTEGVVELDESLEYRCKLDGKIYNG